MDKENYITQINEYKNVILNKYKNLLVAYEESRQLYENILTELGDSTEPVKCAGIYAENNSATVTRWALIKLDGAVMYQSDKYKVKETCTIDLRKQNRVVGTQFYLKAVVEGSDSTSNILLEYDPNASFVKFEVRGTTFNTWINYLGLAPAPPL